MAGLDAAAEELRGLMGGDGFIRRDRKRRALFVSDFPARLARADAQALKTRLEQAGWLVGGKDSLALLDWPLSGYQRFFSRLQARGGPAPWPVSGLCRILEKHPAEMDESMLEEARAALLLWDSGATGALMRLAGESLAVRLRKQLPAPHFFLPLLHNTRDKEV